MEDYSKTIISDGNLAKIIALISFTFGTLLLLLYKIDQSDNYVMIGLIYVIIALFFNTIMFLKLMYNLIVYKQLYLFQLGSITIILLNIPITFFYMHLVFNNFKINLF